MNTVQTVASFGSLEFIWSPQTATEKRRSEGLGLDPTAGPSAFALLKRVLVAMNYRPGPGAGLQKPSVEPFVLLFFFSCSHSPQSREKALPAHGGYVYNSQPSGIV